MQQPILIVLHQEHSTPGRVGNALRQLGYDGLMRGRRVVVAGIGNKIAVSLMRFIPNALLMAAVDRRMGSAGGQ